jgi:thioredoxin-like negative regulator of GroEL
VNSIPDVRIFRSGTQIDGFVGLAPKEDIDSMLKRHE